MCCMQVCCFYFSLQQYCLKMTIEVKVEGLFIRLLLLHVIKNKTSKILLPLQVLIQGPMMMFNQVE